MRRRTLRLSRCAIKAGHSVGPPQPGLSTEKKIHKIDGHPQLWAPSQHPRSQSATQDCFERRRTSSKKAKDTIVSLLIPLWLRAYRWALQIIEKMPDLFRCGVSAPTEPALSTPHFSRTQGSGWGASMMRRSFKCYKATEATGSVLGVVLLVEGTFTYYCVARHVIRVGQPLSSLQCRMRSLKTETPEQLQPVIDEIREERPGEIAWIRIAAARGRPLAQTRGTSGRDFARTDIETMRKQPGHNRSEIRSTLAVAILLPLPFGN